MTDRYLLVGLALGLLLVGVYVFIRAARFGQKPDASEGLRLILSAMGVLTAIKICGLALWDARLDLLLDSERAYIFLGGFMALWACSDSIVSAMNNAAQPPFVPSARVKPSRAKDAVVGESVVKRAS